MIVHGIFSFLLNWIDLVCYWHHCAVFYRKYCSIYKKRKMFDKLSFHSELPISTTNQIHRLKFMKTLVSYAMSNFILSGVLTCFFYFWFWMLFKAMKDEFKNMYTMKTARMYTSFFCRNRSQHLNLLSLLQQTCQ